NPRGALAETGDERQARGPGRQLRSRIIEKNRSRLRWNEIVGARQDFAQLGVELNLPVLGVPLATRPHEEALDLLRGEREYGAAGLRVKCHRIGVGARLIYSHFRSM